MDFPDQISFGESIEFMEVLLKAGLLAEDIYNLVQNPAAAKAMILAMREHEGFPLINGRFHFLNKKIELVREWPGVTGEQIDTALNEAKERIARFERESPKNKLLNIVVSVYLADAPTTLTYACDRLRETYGKTLQEWEMVYGEIDANRVRYLQDEEGIPIVPIYRDCVRIEVVDLGAHSGKASPREVWGRNSAHFAVIYAAAEDPFWVRQISSEHNPPVLICGLEINVPDSDSGEWGSVPGIGQDYDPYDGMVVLGGNWKDSPNRCRKPTIWE